MDSPAFLHQVRALGILSDEQLTAVSQRFAPAAPLHELTGALVDQGWMTPYQIERIWAGKAKGLVLGQYCVLAELGQGGFGCVYKARHLLMNRVVALKVIAPEKVDDSRARAWFRREVLASTRLEHPNIVMAYDANEFEDILFLVMEYVDGPNLAEAVKMQGPLPIGLACALLLQSARALQYANEKGVVHRDIKPANLLLPRAANARAVEVSAAARNGARQHGAMPDADQVLIKIVDFGLARLQSHGTPNTLMGLKEKSFVGTPDFISPEQARNVHDVDIRADLYSLGCTFFFALTGRPPFKGKTPLDIVLQHLEKEPPGLETLRPETPPALVSIVRRLMGKKPEQRFQSPTELLAELGFFFGSGALRASAAPAGPMPPPASAPALNGARLASSPNLDRPAPIGVCADADHNLPRTVIVAAEPITSQSIPPAPAEADAAHDRLARSGAASAATLQEQGSEDRPGTGGPMREQLPFPALWRRWTAVIAEVIGRQQPSLSEAAYSGLYADLLCAARIQAKAAGAPALGAAAVFGSVETAVAAWLTLRTLQQTDPQTLASLWATCRQLEQRLGLGHSAYRLGPLAATVAVVSLLIALAGAFLFATGHSVVPQGATVASVKQLVTAHPLLAVALAVPPLVLGSFFFLARMARN